jgi:sRNA-binding regulator protein Hfq
VLQTVILKNGEKIRGEVMSLNKKSCIVKVGKKRERIDRDTIHLIEFKLATF